MRIGVETIYDSYNFGCFLQAYGLQNYLRSLGHDAFVYDHSGLKDLIKRRYFAKSIKRTILKLKRYNVFSQSWKQLDVRQFKETSYVDLTIIGSDEIWNIENCSFAHIPQFYGIGNKSKKVMTYGPSLGFSTIDSYRDKAELLQGLLSIQKHCVRDSFTEDFLHKIGVDDVERICDPTFLIYDKWNSLRQPSPVKGDYLLYYSYCEDTPFRDYIKQFAKDNDLKVVVAGFDYKWCDEQIICNPFEFLDLMANAKYVVTSTFHGSIFSIIFRKNFVTIHPNVKVTDLTGHYGINNNFDSPDDYTTFASILQNNIDYNKVFEIIQRDSNHSKQILKFKIS